MRKILMIVVLGLFLSENAYALKFYDCYVKKVKDKDVEAHLKERGVFGKYDNTN